MLRKREKERENEGECYFSDSYIVVLLGQIKLVGTWRAFSLIFSRTETGGSTHTHSLQRDSRLQMLRRSTEKVSLTQLDWKIQSIKSCSMALQTMRENFCFVFSVFVKHSKCGQPNAVSFSECKIRTLTRYLKVFDANNYFRSEKIIINSQ